MKDTAKGTENPPGEVGPKPPGDSDDGRRVGRVDEIRRDSAQGPTARTFSSRSSPNTPEAATGPKGKAKKRPAGRGQLRRPRPRPGSPSDGAARPRLRSRGPAGRGLRPGWGSGVERGVLERRCRRSQGAADCSGTLSSAPKRRRLLRTAVVCSESPRFCRSQDVLRGRKASPDAPFFLRKVMKHCVCPLQRQPSLTPPDQSPSSCGERARRDRFATSSHILGSSRALPTTPAERGPSRARSARCAGRDVRRPGLGHDPGFRAAVRAWSDCGRRRRRHRTGEIARERLSPSPFLGGRRGQNGCRRRTTVVASHIRYVVPPLQVPRWGALMKAPSRQYKSGRPLLGPEITYLMKCYCHCNANQGTLCWDLESHM